MMERSKNAETASKNTITNPDEEYHERPEWAWLTED